MKKSISLVSLALLFTLACAAQEYTNAVGIRLGPDAPAIAPGFTIKHFLNEVNAVEAIIGVNNGIGVCGLYEWHHPIPSLNHLNWFIGAGGYAAFRNGNYNNNRSGKSYIGGAGIIGLDYKFEEVPINVSIDWKPELNLISDVRFESNAVGVSIRFTF
jgi:hypothetical protein